MGDDRWSTLGVARSVGRRACPEVVVAIAGQGLLYVKSKSLAKGPRGSKALSCWLLRELTTGDDLPLYRSLLLPRHIHA